MDHIEHKFICLSEIKFADPGADGLATRGFTGYGAFFGNLDAYGDVIQKGAFKDTLKDWNKTKKLPPMLVQHGGWMMTDMDALPIGMWDAMSEDETGLYVKGRLINLDTERGKTIHGAMKEGALDGMSIGYRAKEFSLGTKPDEPRRTLKKIDLMEVSVVTFPANGKARVSSVKNAGMVKTIRDFEELLRDAGFSHAQAKAIASSGFKAADHRDEDEADVVAALRRNIEKLTSN